MLSTLVRSARYRLVVVALLLVAIPAFAQTGGTTTGSIVGNVSVTGGSGIPGVTVTVASPVLQGDRTAYTGDNGDFVVRGLPPGQYTARFELSGMAAVERSVRVDLGGAARVEVVMAPQATAETIEVVATAPSALTTTQLGANIRQDVVNRLPMARTLSNIALQAPGVTNTGFNAGQIRVAGATAFDNVFMVDGTDISDNLFGTPSALTIEDSIAETQVITGGVSAEYGRFTGGVVNAITKSGGNEFTGTGRGDFTNPDWSEKTPWQEAGSRTNAAGTALAQCTDQIITVTDPRTGQPITDAGSTAGTRVGRSLCAGTTTATTFTDDISHVLSATLGGPILRDRLWFFAAYRNVETEATGALTENSYQFVSANSNPRYEGKLTGSIARNHSLQASYLKNEQTRTNTQGLGGQVDVSTLADRQDPQSRLAVFYNGIITSNLFTELKYSKKEAEILGGGGSLTDIRNSPFISRNGAQRVFNAPYFDATDPTARNNEDITATLSYFLSTRSIGSHDIKGGYEDYASTNVGGNSQSATGYVFFANPLRDAAGAIVRDAQGRFIPVFVNADSSTSTNSFTLINNWRAERGAQVEVTTRSFFLNDTWNLNKNFSFNLGVRHEVVSGDATGGIETVDTTTTVPRLGASYDVRGNGRTKIDLTYGHYAGKYNERQFGQNGAGGNPAIVQYAYVGPNGQGLDFAPAFDLNNYIPIFGRFPTASVFADPDLRSPIVKEWTLGLGQALGRWGFGKVTYIRRDWADFVDDFIDAANGRTVVNVTPTFSVTSDNIIVGNQSELEKDYEAITLLSQLNPFSRFNMQIAYTHELRNHGNYVGEAANQPGNNTVFGDYPGFYNEDRHYPSGRLPGYQKHRLRALGTYALELGRIGTFDIGAAYTYNSGNPYSLSGALTTFTPAQQTVRGQYVNPPTSQTLFYNQRGQYLFPSFDQVDLSLTYSLPIWRTLAPWVKFDVFNVMNETPLLAWNTDVTVVPVGAPTSINGTNNGPVSGADSFGLPNAYNLGANFGRATSNASFQAARQYQVSAGIRF